MPFEMRGREKTVHLGDRNYELIRARGDGNCLFHAAGHGLVVGGQQNAALGNHTLFRAQVVNYVAAHAKDTTALGFKLREGMGINQNLQGLVTVDQGRVIDRRVEFLRGARNWGDEACITAIEQLYDVQVLVFDDSGQMAALLVPYYESSFPDGKDDQLRLCIRLRGANPVHYDVYLPDHVALRDDLVAMVDEPKQGAEVSQSAKEPWAYHLNRKGLKLFTPAIGPTQMSYSRAVLEGIGNQRVVKSVVAALGNQLNVVQAPARVVGVHFRNRTDNEELRSASFSAATDAEVLAQTVHEPLVLPLVRVDEEPVNLIDLTSTDLIVDLERGKADMPAVIHYRLFQRARGTLGRGVANDGLIDEGDIDLVKSEDIEDPPRTRFTITGSQIPEHTALMMTWQASPFQIVVSSDRGFEVDASAWTHAHVPSEMDVLWAERYALARVMMLDDKAGLLTALDLGATVGELANQTLDLRPEGREEFAMPQDKETELQQLLTATGVGCMDANKQSYVVEVADDEFYVSTSWASMASLVLDEKTGRYQLAALYWSGDRRDAFFANADDLAAPNRRMQVQGLDRVDRVQALVYAAWTALGNVQSAMSTQEASLLFPQLRSKRFYASQWVFTGTESEENDLGLLFEQRYTTAEERVRALRQNLEAAGLLAELDFAVAELQMPLYNDQIQPIAQHISVEDCAELCRRMRISVGAHRKSLIEENFRLDSEEVEGEKSFDLDGGTRLEAGLDWKRHVFDPPLTVTCVVTAGISSCAGGVTVPVGKGPPSHVMMWHLDASLSIPLHAEMNRLWPKGKDAPAFRTIALVTPSLWELNKYRPDNLYPPSVLADSRGVFVARGMHWYASQPVVAGCDLFGVDCRAKRQVDLVFTYDVDNRAEALRPWANAESEDAGAVLFHLHQRLFGTHRYQDADPKSIEELMTYIAKVTSKEQEAQAAIKLYKRANINKSCRVPAITGALVDSMAEQAHALLELPRLVAGEKGDQELALYALEKIMASRWLPGRGLR